MSAASFTEIDEKVQAVQPVHSDAKAVVELLETEDVSNDNNDVITRRMNLCIGTTETSFCKLLRPCKNCPCFQKMVLLFNRM